MSFPPDEIEPDLLGEDLAGEESLLLADGGMASELGAEDPTAALREIMPERLGDSIDWRVTLDEQDREALGRRLVMEYEHFRSQTADRRANAETWRRDKAMLEADQPGPWDNSSALRAPYTAIACNAHTTKLNGQLMGADPPFGAVARKPDAQEIAPVIEEAVNASLEEAQWRQVARLVHQELPVVAPCAVLVEWETKTRRVPTVVVDQDEQAMHAQMSAGIEPTEAYVNSIARGRDGKARTSIQWETRTVYDGVKLRCVRFEDLVMLPHTARSDEELWGIGERLYIRGIDLQAGVEAGRYDRESVDELLRLQSDQSDEDAEETGELQGIDTGAGPTDLRAPEYRDYECVELYLLDRLDSDAEQKWYLVTVHLHTGLVLRCQYSPYEHGMPGYELFPYIEHAGQLYGETIAERLATLQDAATAALNQFFDMVDLMVGQSGSFFYDSNASKLRPEQWEWRPGLPLKVESIQGIMPNPLPANAAATLPTLINALGLLKDYADLLTATSNPALGRETDGNKTLGEVQIVMGQSEMIFEDYATGVALRWARVVDRVRWLLVQFSPAGQVQYRRTAAAGDTYEQIEATKLAADVDFVPAGLRQFADAQTRIQRDTLVMQTLQQHPLTMQDWETQARTLRQWLQSMRFPGWENLAAKAEQAAMQLTQIQQIQQAQQLQGGALANEEAEQGLARGEQDQERAAAEEARAQESHAMQQMQGAKELNAPPAGGNGKKR